MSWKKTSTVTESVPCELTCFQHAVNQLSIHSHLGAWFHRYQPQYLSSLKLTFSHLKMEWLEDDRFLFWVISLTTNLGRGFYLLSVSGSRVFSSRFTLPVTNVAPEIDPWKRRFLLETTIFRGELLVSGSVWIPVESFNCRWCDRNRNPAKPKAHRSLRLCSDRLPDLGDVFFSSQKMMPPKTPQNSFEHLQLANGKLMVGREHISGW